MYDLAALEAIEKRYLQDLWRTAVLDGVWERHMDVARFGPVQVSIVAEEPEEPMLNIMLGAGSEGAVAGGHLADAIDWVEWRGVDYRVPVTPGRQAAGLAERWLMERGHEQARTWLKLARDGSPPAFEEPSAIEVHELDDEVAVCETFGFMTEESFWGAHWLGHFFSDLWDRAEWRCYVAYDQEDRCSGAVMLIDGGLAELGPVSCEEAPDAEAGERQAALIHRCVLDAAAAGCDAIFAEAEMPNGGQGLSVGAENLSLAGFKQIFMRTDWRPPRAHVEEAVARRSWLA